MKQGTVVGRKGWACVFLTAACMMFFCCRVGFSQSAYLINSTISSAGHLSTNTILLGARLYALAGSLGQPSGVAILTNAPRKCYSGFLGGAFACHPLEDADGDGLADEYESDNDNDLLTDVAELTGSAFEPLCPTDPNNPDTDGDSQNDGAEAIAGCDPISTASYFSVWPPSRMDAMNGYVIRWSSASNRYYSVSAATGLPGAFVLMGSGIPASYPLNTFTDLTHHGESQIYYRVGVRR